MTRVIFYSNVRDKQAALMILVCKALAKRHLVTLFAESEQAAQAYSDVLWQQDSTSFLPNVLASKSCPTRLAPRQSGSHFNKRGSIGLC